MCNKLIPLLVLVAALLQSALARAQPVSVAGFDAVPVPCASDVLIPVVPSGSSFVSGYIACNAFLAPQAGVGVTNAQLANSSLTLGSTSVSLGGTSGVAGIPLESLYLHNPNISGTVSGSATYSGQQIFGGGVRLSTLPSMPQLLGYDSSGNVQAIIVGANLGLNGTTLSATPSGGGSDVIWPASNALVVSNGTISPGGLSPVNNALIYGTGGAWAALVSTANSILCTNASSVPSLCSPSTVYGLLGSTTLSGDVSGSGTTAIATTVNAVHGVSYPANPSTSTIPVVTSANTVSYDSASQVLSVLGLSVPVTVSQGGSGLSTLTANAIYKGAGTSALLPSAISDNGTTVTSTEPIASTVTTGTAPFVVASTTVVPNLNVGLLNGATFASPPALGYGSTTPEPVAATTLSATGAVTLSGLSSGACVNDLIIRSGNLVGTGPCTAITWPTTGNLVVSNSTTSPTGLAPVNNELVYATGGAWAALATAPSAILCTNASSVPSLCSSSTVQGLLGYLTTNQTITLSGDTSGSGSTAITTTTAKVNGVAYSANPSTNTIPVVTSANTVSYFNAGQVLTVLGFPAYLASPPPIGTSTAAAGVFTSLSAATLSLTGLSSGTCVSSLVINSSNQVVTNSCSSGSVTWPATNSLVVSNSTNSPTGLSPVNNDLVYATGGAWAALASAPSSILCTNSSSVPSLCTTGQVNTLLSLGTMATQAASSVAITGGTITGTTLSGASNTLSSIGLSSLANIAANTVVCNNTGSSAVPIACTVSQINTLLSLGTMATQAASSVAITGGAITGLSSPTNPTDAATKAYVDAAAGGQPPHTPVRLATAAVLPNTPTYNNGSSGVGATLTSSASTTLTVDGTTVNNGDRVLVSQQATGFQDGIYVAAISGSPWVLTRATDFNTAASGNISTGAAVLVTAGSTLVNTSWSLATTGTITVGATALTFVQIGASNTYTADGSTLQLIGSQFSEKNNGTTNTQLAQMAANTIKGNAVSSLANAADISMPSCTDTGGNHLNWVPGTGPTCGTSSVVGNVTTSDVSSTAGRAVTEAGTGGVTITQGPPIGTTGTSTILETDSSGNEKAPVSTTTGTFSGQITSTLAIGTAPFVVTSTTNVANLNASSLGGATFAAPGPIGGGTPSSAAFTTGAFSGAITSTVSTGTGPPFIVASTANVANLNASSLGGATFAAPGPIGSGTPSTAAFTTLSASGAVTGAGFTAIFASPPGPIGSSSPVAGSFTTGSFTGQITSTLAIGTPPLVVTSTTVVPNLNAGLLNGATFASPPATGYGSTTPEPVAATTLSATSAPTGAGFTALFASPPATGYGSTTPEPVAATTISGTTGTFSGAITSTVATGTGPPFIVASTANVANLNAASLNGATFASPPALGYGSTTPEPVAATTLSATIQPTGAGFTALFATPPATGYGSTTPEPVAATTLSATGAVTGAGITSLFASPPSGGYGTTTPEPVAATTLSATSTVSGAGFTSLFASPPAGGYGTTTPEPVAATTLSATSIVSGAGITSLFASPPSGGYGTTTPEPVAATTLSATGAVTGAGITTLFASPPSGGYGTTTPEPVAATTLSATTQPTGAGFTALFASPPGPVGGTTPVAVTGTTVKATTYVDAQTNPYVWEIPNASTTGTIQYSLAKLTGAGTAVIATTSDTTGVVLGCVQSASATTGNAQIAIGGTATCTFDGATTQNDFVQVSTTTGGAVHDTGSTIYPTTGGQIIGRVLSTHASGGNYTMVAFPPSIVPGSGASSSGFNTLSVTSNCTISTTCGSAQNGYHFDNGGATAAVTITLPAIANGLNNCFAVVAAFPIFVQAPSGVHISLGDANGGSASVLTLAQPFENACIYVPYNSTTQWITKSAQGAGITIQ